MRADHPRYNSNMDPDLTAKAAKKTDVWKALPEVWRLINPRRGLLALGLLLMAINRVSGLVLPRVVEIFPGWCDWQEAGPPSYPYRAQHSRRDLSSGPNLLHPHANFYPSPPSA